MENCFDRKVEERNDKVGKPQRSNEVKKEREEKGRYISTETFVTIYASWKGKEEHLEQTFFTLLNDSPPELLHMLMYIIYVPKLSLHSFSLSSKNNYSNTEMGILGAMAKHLDAIIGPGVMLLFPLYASIRAIESPSSLDDQQWLTYWVIYSLITLFELTFWKILVWYNSTQKLFFLFLLQVYSFQRELLAYRIPLWGYIKLVACLWLVLPIFNGAAYIYENIVRKYVKIGRYVNPNYPENQKKVLQMMTLDSRKSVERYIDRYGPDAFERVVKAAEREARKH